MTSAEGEYWDRRYRIEGPIWGDSPSPAALTAAQFLRPGDRVLEVGFGYGRDLLFFARRGCRVEGIDLSAEGCRRARSRVENEGLPPPQLATGRFEDSRYPDASFDLVFSHRVAHLLLSREAMARFALKVQQVLRVGGAVCVGVRNSEDLNPTDMIPVGDKVYEYKDRPGHRIRYWDDETFQEIFGPGFVILRLAAATELESAARPVPCYLTVLVGRKKPDA